VRRHVRIACPADDVWAITGDPTRIAEWFPGIDSAIPYAETGEFITGDHADVVVLDIADGDVLARADTGLGMQSVLFPAPGRDREFYVCAFTGVSRVAVR